LALDTLQYVRRKPLDTRTLEEFQRGAAAYDESRLGLWRWCCIIIGMGVVLCEGAGFVDVASIS
jgi:hypothetical protein